MDEVAALHSRSRPNPSETLANAMRLDTNDEAQVGSYSYRVKAHLDRGSSAMHAGLPVK